MTLLGDTEHETKVGGGGVEVDPQPTLTQTSAGRSLGRRRWVIIVVGTVAALLVSWLICADLVAHVWYQTRQQSLHNQAANASTHIGSEIPKEGQQVGVLQVPSIGLNVTIAQGDTPSVLRSGPGHKTGTPLPGARGNSVIYGHQKDWGAPFKNLGQLTVGSTLYLQAHPGVYKLPETGDFIYTVISVAKTSTSDTRPLAPSDDYRLTLVTNAGGRLSGHNDLVVIAVSGTLGNYVGKAPSGSLEPSTGSLLFNLPVLCILLTVLISRWMIYLLARRHRLIVVVACSAPVIIAAALSIFIEFDLLAFRPLA